MAMFAGNTGLERPGRQLPICDSIRGMATQAVFYLTGSQLPAHGFIKSSRVDSGVAGCNLQPIDGRIITDHALVVRSVSLDDPRLSPMPEIPKNR